MLRRWIIALALGLVAVVYTAYHVHQRALPFTNVAQNPEPLMRGAYHIHSTASHDGRKTSDEIARAAQALGYSFLVMTEHNKQLATSTQAHGVTLISAAEWSNPTFGHVVALGANRPLTSAQRESRDINQHIRDVGGIALPAHPTDRKRPWSGSLHDAGGIEIANVAASARRLGGPAYLSLLKVAAAYPINPTLALAQLIDRDVGALRRWDEQPSEAFAGMCGVDAHGLIDLQNNLKIWNIELVRPRTNWTAQAIVDDIAHGRIHCISGLLQPAFAMRFEVRDAANEVLARAGDAIAVSPTAQLVVETNAGENNAFALVLYRDGAQVSRTSGESLSMPALEPGLYRVEVEINMPNLMFGHRWVPIAYSGRIRLLPSEGNPP